MLKLYCPECGKKGYCAYLYFIAVLVIGAIIGICLVGCKDKAEASNDPVDVTIEGNEIKQVHLRSWGKIPKQNQCPHCGVFSWKRFCTECKKERGNLPFIGVYCPKCKPDGKFTSQTADVTKICGYCGFDKTWKYVYENWQTEPNEPETLHISEVVPVPEVSVDMFGLLTKFIPTWPDYIELDKDLVLRYDFPEPNDPLLIHTPSAYKIFSKGTKIYFKE